MTRFAAVLLAGGRSTRMGRDKAFARWKGEPLWKAQLDKLLALRPEKLMIAGRAEQDFASQLAEISFHADQTSVLCLDDPAGDASGPMGAIARALRAADSPVLVLAVDMPLITAGFLRNRVLAAASETAGVVCRGAQGYECLAAVYVSAMLPLFEDAMAAGDFAIHRVIDTARRKGCCRIIEIAPDEQDMFENLNAPEDAARFLDFQS